MTRVPHPVLRFVGTRLGWRVHRLTRTESGRLAVVALGYVQRAESDPRKWTAWVHQYRVGELFDTRREAGEFLLKHEQASTPRR